MNDEHRQELERLRAKIDMLEQCAEESKATASAGIALIESRGHRALAELDVLLRRIEWLGMTPREKLEDRMSSEAGAFRVVHWAPDPGEGETEDPGQGGRG
ncbi:hypothetical protein [Ectothiorhodospira variabilis]|uniref:hypothetical protein n=1 Tax=Ectothiorhodospira variabilis TaxID=505694 RepID=UPI001EFA7850|nr:hypothetical protein [Ectothiorhodospira variabilis]MCG5495635.1 hypothetical protein [Ectothiorhodospira variabilis]MCG5504696.1 hypothetical protein [Ectothiorhodospira variabilis]MCG5507853.1 hypothetical protein [Ectothiorhodospira variabilis]